MYIIFITATYILLEQLSQLGQSCKSGATIRYIKWEVTLKILKVNSKAEVIVTG